jgi:hypothetical protein
VREAVIIWETDVAAPLEDLGDSWTASSAFHIPVDPPPSFQCKQIAITWKIAVMVKVGRSPEWRYDLPLVVRPARFLEADSTNPVAI